MTFNGTHFNDPVVLSMTRKQFILVGGRGNSLTAEQLGEAYDIMKRLNSPNVGNYTSAFKSLKNENGIKLSTSSADSKSAISDDNKPV